MFDLLIHSAAELVTVAAHGARVKTGADMRELHIIPDGAVGITDGRIAWVGNSSEVSEKDASDVIDARGRTVLPGFVDSHTHLVFAGNREHDFARRIAGATYAEIAAAGGGINTTVKATRAASLVELLDLALNRLDSCLQHGSTTVEIKSGYGLDFENEMKMLQVIRELRELHVVKTVPTFLGAHVVPFDYRDRRAEYVDMLIHRLLPQIAADGLAEFCDVFAEANAFSLDETRAIFHAARALGLKLKLHADQITPGGGAGVAAVHGAVSADHLDHSSDADLRSMVDAGTVATLLPGVSLFLGEEWPDARRFIDAGVPTAIATDMNPGSCMSENMQLMMSLAVMRMHMTMEEAITAATLNAAAAIDRSDSIGSIEVGKVADILIFDASNHHQIPYHFGINHLATVVADGHVVLDKHLAEAGDI